MKMLSLIRAIALSSIASSALVLAQTTTDDSPTACLDSGIIVGTTTSLPGGAATVNRFLGIPFASPPQRFSPPQPPAQWELPIDTKAWKPACIQQFNYPEASRNFTFSVFNNPPSEESEDCLYLNVYAPASPAPPSGRAVLYWIYGGSLQFGNAGQRSYDGSRFAAYEDVIVVSVNYRTNVFGFPGSPELPLTGRNLGFLDQRLGLRWVQRNIRQFGGDPSKVTIFGESAGAFSVDALITSFPKDSKPPFRAAILQSGQYSYRGATAGNATATNEASWQRLLSAVNCTNIACARALPATTLKDTIERNGITFSPVADNITLVSNPAGARSSGNIAYIPVLSGTNSQEGRVFTVGQNDLDTYLNGTFSFAPQLIPAVRAAYPLGTLGLETPYDVIAQIFTELRFQCPQALFANATARANIPSYRYFFNATFPNTQTFPNAGAYHASEIPIVYRTYNATTATAQQNAVSQSMQNAWARFAKNPAGGPGWNTVGSGAQYAGGAADLDLGLWGNVGSVPGGGITVVRSGEVDRRCALFTTLLGGP